MQKEGKKQLTQEEKDSARLLRSQGETLGAIASLFNVSEVAIFKLTQDMKPAQRRWNRGGKLTREQKQEAIQRRLAGETLEAIAKSYGVTASNIYRITLKARPAENWPHLRHKKPLTDEQKMEITRRRLAGETLGVIAKSYGVSAPYVSQITQKAKPAGGWPKRPR